MLNAVTEEVDAVTLNESVDSIDANISDVQQTVLWKWAIAHPTALKTSVAYSKVSKAFMKH